MYHSDQLQSATIDLSRASEVVLATKSVLTEYRTSEYWKKVYDYATEVANLHCISIQPTSRKRKRPSHLADSVILETVGSREDRSTSEVFRSQFYFPVIDKFLQELNRRFHDKNIDIMKGVSACTPTSSTFLLHSDLKTFAEMYDIDTATLEVEASLVKTVLKPDINTVATFRSYLHSCQPAYYTLCQLTQIALTITVTSAESEMSFSALKRIKSRMRTRMTEETLSDLAILAIEKEVAQKLNHDDIIDKFASADKNRRIVLF